MGKKKMKNLKDSSLSDLQKMDQDLAREVFELRNTLAIQRKLDKPHLLKAKRKERARVLTLLTKQQKEGAFV